MERLISGDVGGTKTNLALFSTDKGPHAPIVRMNYSSASYDSFDALLSDFMQKTGAQADLAVFGVAGPVEGTVARITNLSWTIDAGRLSSTLGIKKVRLLNDLEAVAHGVPVLRPMDLHVLNRGETDQNGVISVIAPGTGLGQSYLTWNGHHYLAHASEGGHTDFAPRNRREIQLLEYLLDRHDHVSYERICSGSGLPNVYCFLREKVLLQEPDWLKKEMDTTEDKTALIIRAAMDEARTCDLCRETLRMFVTILGAEAGNLALKLLPHGGIYIGGGIPPRIKDAFLSYGFMDAFLQKGRLSRILTRLPICIILNTDVGLIGSAGYGFNILAA
jgi:glucokinase